MKIKILFIFIILFLLFLIVFWPNLRFDFINSLEDLSTSNSIISPKENPDDDAKDSSITSPKENPDNNPKSSKSLLLDIKDNDFYIGEDNAPITIIEYASMSCSHCADFHNDTLQELKSEYIDTGKVKFIFRDFPFNYPALAGSMILRCVPDDVRYDYMNALYKLQNNWVARDHSKTREELYKIMQSGGMQLDDFDECLSNVDLENQLLEAVMDAQKEYKIDSTPSFIINGVLYTGNKNIKEFRQIIDKILSQ